MFNFSMVGEVGVPLSIIINGLGKGAGAKAPLIDNGYFGCFPHLGEAP
jgi:hypothetical protein